MADQKSVRVIEIKVSAGDGGALKKMADSMGLLNSRVKNIISSALSKTTIGTQGSLPEDTYITTIKKVATDTINVVDNLVIPVNIFGKSFFLIVEHFEY